MPFLHNMVIVALMASLRQVLTAVLVCVAAIAASAQTTRDWKQHPAIAELEMPQELYGMGDVHGDYDRMVELLAAGHLIAGRPAKPEEVRWTGGKAVLVCTGDFIDKYDHALSVIALFRAIGPQAEKNGGSVVVMLGNHEAEFLAAGGEKKKQTEFMKELLGGGLNGADVARGEDAAGIGAWLRNLPVAAKVGEWFFCHAGNTGGRKVEELRLELEMDITAHGFGAPILGNPNSLLEARMHPRQWWDWNGTDVELKEIGDSKLKLDEIGVASERRLRKIVEALGCHHLVIGHQPGKIVFADGSVREAGEVYCKFNGLIFLLDTGMSRGQVSGREALLRVRQQLGHAVVSVVYVDGEKAVAR
jgi:hypothetical protein